MSATNKSYKKYDYISRYEAFPYYFNTLDNKYFYGITANLRKSEVGYVAYKVKPGDTYDSIALDNYGSPLFYWIVCDFNNISDCFSTPKVGSILNLPALNSISFEG